MLNKKKSIQIWNSICSLLVFCLPCSYVPRIVQTRPICFGRTKKIICHWLNGSIYDATKSINQINWIISNFRWIKFLCRLPDCSMNEMYKGPMNPLCGNRTWQNKQNLPLRRLPKKSTKISRFRQHVNQKSVSISLRSFIQIGCGQQCGAENKFFQFWINFHNAICVFPQSVNRD